MLNSPIQQKLTNTTKLFPKQKGLWICYQRQGSKTLKKCINPIPKMSLFSFHFPRHDRNSILCRTYFAFDHFIQERPKKILAKPFCNRITYLALKIRHFPFDLTPWRNKKQPFLSLSKRITQVTWLSRLTCSLPGNDYQSFVKVLKGTANNNRRL